MAKSSFMLSSILVLVLLMFFSRVKFSVARAATSYRGVENMRKKIDSQQILRELLVNDLGNKMEQNYRRVMMNKDRVAPGGPDPQHHY
ncbi:hypothetical protein R3W88_005605 [Solanum pinnatisectum]|uniref:CLAVATA3/ESR (CLE)-related protein n=1 Tax=Solanum pinnatisectum TaxID=50273 RepID=A0AAV9KD08_9SOLN|nr:hypothetical protein R3W88_005605 [Solanum pinnatisectum]